MRDIIEGKGVYLKPLPEDIEKHKAFSEFLFETSRRRGKPGSRTMLQRRQRAELMAIRGRYEDYTTEELTNLARHLSYWPHEVIAAHTLIYK